MKKLPTLLMFLLLIGCDHTPTKPQNPEKETTVEILNSLTQDTVRYAEIENTLYIVKDGIVIRKIYNQSSALKTSMLMIILFFFVGLLIGIFSDN